MKKLPKPSLNSCLPLFILFLICVLIYLNSGLPEYAVSEVGFYTMIGIVAVLAVIDLVRGLR